MADATDTVDVKDFAAEIGMSEEQVRGLIGWGEVTPAADGRIPKSEAGVFRRSRAYHEAGHVVVAKLVGWTVYEVSIKPNILLGTGGSVPISPPPSEDPASPDYDSADAMLVRVRNLVCFEKQAMISAAGREGQELGTGRAPVDDASAEDTALIERFSGSHPELKHTKGIDALHERCTEARRLLESKRSALDAIASELITKTTLRNEIDALLLAHGV